MNCSNSFVLSALSVWAHFAYSEEEGTYSANNYEDDVPAEVKQRRLDELMILQQEISAEVEAEKVGKILKRDYRPQGG